MNTLKCGNCVHYDPILAREEKETERGWCVERSIYPLKEGPGQVYPETAKRHKDPKALGKPFIVKKEVVLEGCPYARKGANQVEKKRAAQIKLDKKGKRIH